MSFAIPLLFIIGISGNLVIITKRRFEEVLPVSLMLSVLIVFISGLVGNLMLGYYACIGFAALFYIILLIKLFIQKDLKSVFNKILTPGFVIFIFIYVFIFILNYRRGFNSWDEISHWGPMVKETLRLNKFYSVSESFLAVHKDYPPIVTLFESLWCKLCGGYSEAYLYRSLQILSLSLFFPALSHFEWKRSYDFVVKMALVMIAIISINLISLGGVDFYSNISTDCLLGLMLAYGLSILFYEKHISMFGIFRLSVALSFLLLTKQMGIAFFFLILGAFILNTLVVNRKQLVVNSKHFLSKKNLIRVAFMLLMIVIIPYLFKSVWEMLIVSNNITGQFSLSAISFSKLVGIVKGSIGEVYQHTTVLNFAMNFLTHELFTRPITLAYWQLMLLSIVLFYVVANFGKKYIEAIQIHWLSFILFCGAGAYAFAMFLLYVFNFGSYEGPRLASFDRYMNTYWFAIMTLAMMLFLFIEGNKESEKSKTSYFTIGTLILFLWIVVFSPQTIYNLVPVIHNQSISANYVADANIIKSKTTENDKVFIISQNSNGFVNYSLGYLLLPEYCNTNSYYSLGVPYSESDVWTNNLTVTEWTTILEYYDYLYLQNIDAQFVSTYSSIFIDKSTLLSKQLYKITKKENSIVLKLVK